jgi:nucleoside-diphosphate-sugar epimerase
MERGVKHLLCFGFGFSASTLAAGLDRKAWRVTGTSRSDEGVAAIEASGFEGVRFDQYTDIPDSVTHVVSSVPPGAGDPVIARFGAQLARRKFDWVAHLSTTGVYGDHQGRLVDEDFPLTPNTERGEKRVTAEAQWLQLFHDHGLPVHVFRLAGIYGPGRNQLLTVRDGTAKRVIKQGQVFSRIHVEDIAGVMLASMSRPNPGRVYNVADDEPCPPQNVVAYAAGLLGVEPPPEIAFEDAELTPMARSFFADSKRVSNARIKNELGYHFKYPNYRVGLKSLL